MSAKVKCAGCDNDSPKSSWTMCTRCGAQLAYMEDDPVPSFCSYCLLRKKDEARGLDYDDDEFAPTSVLDPYRSLIDVLSEAANQAIHGKGRERHAVRGEAFEDQQICEITRRVGYGFALGQAVKKIYECQRLPAAEAGIQEIFGAINYLASAVIVIRQIEERTQKQKAADLARHQKEFAAEQAREEEQRQHMDEMLGGRE